MAFKIERVGPDAIRLVMGVGFVAEDAWGVHEFLEKSPPSTRVSIDFRRVRDCADFALSLLARDILAGRAAVEVVGLTQHQERVLSYFGVDPRASVAVADFDPI